MKFLHITRKLTLGLAGCAVALCALADDAYPNRPIKVVVPYAAGGTGDTLIRLLAQRMSVDLKQPIVIENRPGASGLIGSNAVRLAAPDGYTLLFTTSSALIGAIVKSPPPFDPYNDFAPIGRAVAYPHFVVINPEIPARTLQEFIAYAKSRNEPLFHTSIGIGSTGHLACEQIALAAGFQLNYVPYNAIPAALQSVMTNQTQLICDSVAGSRAYVEQGKLRGLAVTSAKRQPQVPDVPATAEAGVLGVESGVWLGLLAPRATPTAILQKVNQAYNAALASPEMAMRAQTLGMNILHETPEQATAAIRADLNQWREVIRVKQIKVVD